MRSIYEHITIICDTTQLLKTIARDATKPTNGSLALPACVCVCVGYNNTHTQRAHRVWENEELVSIHRCDGSK